MSTMSDGIDGVIVHALEPHEDPRGWLVEIFRSDEWPAELAPQMAYVSMTRPGVGRGPHEHRSQTDTFCFTGPGTFEVRLWDNRPASASYGRRMVLRAGTEAPAVVVIPPGVVHGYRNVDGVDAFVVNLPNRLYRGQGSREPVDEIRHEDDPSSPFRLFD